MVERAPIISIFPASGGPAVTRGVLIKANGEDPREGAAVGLFGLWPESLAQEEFSVLVPPSPKVPAAEWLAPKEVGLLKLGGGKGAPKLAVVVLDGKPTREGPVGNQEVRQHNFLGIAANESWAVALEAVRGEELKQLREISRFAPSRHRTPPAGAVSVPRREPTPPPAPKKLPPDWLAANAEWGAFFCRFIVRAD